jgi:hypothetical protein
MHGLSRFKNNAALDELVSRKTVRGPEADRLRMEALATDRSNPLEVKCVSMETSDALRHLVATEDRQQQKQ